MGGRGASSGMSASTLTDAEIQSIKGYTNTAYETINTWLRLDRNWQNSPLSDIIENLDSAIAKSSINNPMTVYRGVSLESLGINDISQVSSLDGVTIVEKGFMSTSTSSKTAQSFVNKLKYQEDIPGIVVQIHIPKSRGLAMNVNNVSSQGGYENEILISRGNAIRYKYANGTLIGTIVRKHK